MRKLSLSNFLYEILLTNNIYHTISRITFIHISNKNLKSASLIYKFLIFRFWSMCASERKFQQYLIMNAVEFWIYVSVIKQIMLKTYFVPTSSFNACDIFIYICSFSPTMSCIRHKLYKHVCLHGCMHLY